MVVKIKNLIKKYNNQNQKSYSKGRKMRINHQISTQKRSLITKKILLWMDSGIWNFQKETKRSAEVDRVELLGKKV